MSGLRAILTCVEFSDLLEITLPYNRLHFSDVMIVTSTNDASNVQPIATTNNARMFVTDSFYSDGAIFNKFKALEEGLDAFGRHGWLAILDADVLWPKDLLIGAISKKDDPNNHWLNIVRGYEHDCIGTQLFPGQLLSPFRHMYDPLCYVPETGKVYIPPENQWDKYPIHRNTAEWAGYTQIFHASDPHLGPAPWHEINWTTAGACDSWFQSKWPAHCKVRPPWECLHLGAAGQNWAGRATPYLDGTEHPDSKTRLARVSQLWRDRRTLRDAGRDPYFNEKIQK